MIWFDLLCLTPLSAIFQLFVRRGLSRRNNIIFVVNGGYIFSGIRIFEYRYCFSVHWPFEFVDSMTLQPHKLWKSINRSLFLALPIFWHSLQHSPYSIYFQFLNCVMEFEPFSMILRKFSFSIKFKFPIMKWPVWLYFNGALW